MNVGGTDAAGLQAAACFISSHVMLSSVSRHLFLQVKDSDANHQLRAERLT